MDKTKNLITKILEECERELNLIQITEKLEKKNHNISYETAWKNVKEMSERSILIRTGKGKPWKHYYQLNKEYNQE